MGKNQKYLLGAPLESFKSGHLPTKSCVLKNIYHFQSDQKATFNESATLTTKLLLDFYKNRGIETISKQSIKRKVLRLRDSYNNLCKHKTRRSAKQIDNETKFMIAMREIFPVENANVVRGPPKRVDFGRRNKQIMLPKNFQEAAEKNASSNPKHNVENNGENGDGANEARTVIQSKSGRKIRKLM